MRPISIEAPREVHLVKKLIARGCLKAWRNRKDRGKIHYTETRPLRRARLKLEARLVKQNWHPQVAYETAKFLGVAK